MEKLLQQVINRHINIKGDSFLEVMGIDDMKKDRTIRSKFFDVRKINISKIYDEAEIFNTGSYGVFFSFNPLSKPKRIKDNVKKIIYIFLDLDAADESHKNIVITFLEENKFKYSYVAKSGGGYHLLLPVDLDKKFEYKVRNFLYYLKNNVCNKVDINTQDMSRTIRFPNSIHNKSNDGFELVTLFCQLPNDNNIKKNTKLLDDFQYENLKGEIDNQYLNTVKKKDVFFTTILSNKDNWHKYYDMLNTSKDRNGNFIKNLGLFIKNNYYLLQTSELFLNNWERTRTQALKGWIKKGFDNDMQVNYIELFKWCKDNNLEEFIELIKTQLKDDFFDKIEFYYLEEEKQDYQYLIYYPEKNYYIQKNLIGLKDLIYYESKELGVDLANFFNLKDKKYEPGKKSWDELPFQKQLGVIKSSIHKKIEKENRIKLVYNINYAPVNDKFIWFDGKKYFNVYRKTEIWDYKSDKNEEYFPHIKELILNLCGNNDKYYDWFIKWLSYIVKNPEYKLPTAIIFQGRQGSGKGVLRTHILDNIFGNNIQEINQTHLESQFNEYLLGKQIIIANEVIHNENKALLPNILKNLVTDPTITISRKFRKEIECKNYTHWIFCTNNDNPLKIDKDDRRYSVFYSERLKGSEKNAVKFVRSLQKNLDYELRQFITYLKSLKVSEYEVRFPIMTEAKQDIIELNKDSFDKFRESMFSYKTLKEMFTVVFCNDYTYITKEDFGDGEKYILTEKLYDLYRMWCNNSNEKGIFSKQNFSRKMSGIKCKSYPKRKDDRVFRMYNVTDIEKLMEIKQ